MNNVFARDTSIASATPVASSCYTALDLTKPTPPATRTRRNVAEADTEQFRVAIACHSKQKSLL